MKINILSVNKQGEKGSIQILNNIQKIVRFICIMTFSPTSYHVELCVVIIALKDGKK